MTNKHKFLSLMLIGAATLSLLSACDDSSKQAEQTQETTMESSMPIAAPVQAINVVDAKSFATAQGASTGAVFMTIQNPGTESDRLIGVSTSVSPTVELHRTAVDESGVMTMSKLDGIDLIAGSDTLLNSDGLHIMLLGLTTPLVEGTTFDVTLDFEKAGDMVVPVTVVSAGATMIDDHSGHEGHDMGTSETTPVEDGATMDNTAPTVETHTTETMETVPSTESTDEIPAVIEETIPETKIDAPVVPDEQPAQ